MDTLGIPKEIIQKADAVLMRLLTVYVATQLAQTRKLEMALGPEGREQVVLACVRDAHILVDACFPPNGNG